LKLYTSRSYSVSIIELWSKKSAEKQFMAIGIS